MKDRIEEIKEKNAKRDLIRGHYYGDTVRKLFLYIAILMLVGAAFFKEYLMPPLITVLGVLVFALAAGITNPKQAFSVFFDFLVSLGGTLIFGYMSILTYKDFPFLFFLVNLVLALFSLYALYLSSKTLRGKFVPN